MSGRVVGSSSGRRRIVARRASFAAAVTAIAITFFPQRALATDFELTGALGVESNGAFRGVKSTNMNPPVYGYLELVRGELLAGVFSNPVRIAGETTPLVLTYAAWKPSAGGYDLEIGARYYAFPGSTDFTFDFEPDGVIDHSGHKGLFEAQAGVRRIFKGGRVHLRAFYTPDDFAETGPSWYLNGEARASLGGGFDLRAAVGASLPSNDRFSQDYVDYRIGVHKSAFGLDMFLRYSDTAGFEGADNSVIVFGVERAWTIASSAGIEARRYDKIRNDWLIDKSLLGLRR